MSGSFVEQVGKDYSPDPQEDVVDSLFKQYERVIVESIVTSFGMDFLLFHKADQHGGDVDTIHSVREIGKDPKMTYKKKSHEIAYETREPYDRAAYHSDDTYRTTVREAKKEFQDEGKWVEDAYTGGRIGYGKGLPLEKQAQLDHVIAAKAVYEDRGRVLAGKSGIELANSPDNLRFTNAKLNNNMKAKDIPEYIAWCEANPEKVDWNGVKGQPLSEDVKKRLMDEYTRAQRSLDRQLTQYYTSPEFLKYTAAAAGKVGAKMGLRQVFGFVFMEIWFAVKEEFEKAKRQDSFDLEIFCKALANGIKRGAMNAKSKYREMLEKFGEGAVAGALGSITTTLCNIFFTTAKSTVRIIRQAWASLIEATKILLFNPNNLLFGERFRAAIKVLATGASIILGRSVQTMVADALSKTRLVAFSAVSDIIPTFCGVFLTGIMSCTLLYFLDHNKVINAAVQKLNEVPSVELSIMEFKQQATYFEKYAAELMQIDLKKFQEEIDAYEKATEYLEQANDDVGLNRALKFAYEKLGIALPWQGDFDAFMQGEDHLVFE